MNNPAIEIRGLEKSFPHFKLGPLDLTVPEGAIYGLIGPNGSGKTTTIDLMLGMGREESGSIKVHGMDHRKDEVKVKQGIGYVSPELDYATWGKVGKAINFVRGFYPDWDDAYCRELISRFKINTAEKVSALSYGNKVRLALLLALSHRPKILLLDEPTVGLDAVVKREVFAELLQAVQDEKRTVLISSHGLSDIERFADHLGIIKDGKLLLEGSTAEIIERYQFVDLTTDNSINLTGLRMLRKESNRCRALLDTQALSIEQLERSGASDLITTPVNLEDLFVALMGEAKVR
jgi:ABC-type multidrug transport system ATPase subunit